MDFSELYIKMCDCPEIQKQFSISMKQLEWRGYVQIANEDGSVFEYERYIRLIDDSIVVRLPQSLFIWLPRQDQLQEMVYTDETRERYGCPKSRWLVFRINKFWLSYEPPMVTRDNMCKEYPPNYCDQFDSMEQLWLAFVMKELHSKVWNGEKWEVINEKS